jgi:lipoate---protein ligase
VTWAVDRHRGPADELHGLELRDDGRRRIWTMDVTGPALVLGSTQSLASVDVEAAARRGAAVVRRRSGGGAVWIEPGDPLWVDVVVPRGDPLWDDDVGRSFLPIGRAWQRALAAAGVAGTRVHEGPAIRTEWSAAVCFAGTGPGEVVADEGHPAGDMTGKLVGISQRRTRAGARFQCALPRRWDPEPLERLVRPRPPAGALDGCASGIGDLAAVDLVAALVAALA